MVYSISLLHKWYSIINFWQAQHTPIPIRMDIENISKTSSSLHMA